MASYAMYLPVGQELKDLATADILLSVGFALVLSGGLAGAASTPAAFISLLPITFLAVTLSFVLHEYMHKIVAQRFGAIAAFRVSFNGLVFTLFTAMFGLMVGVPGATVIYTNTFTRREEGLVSLAGPLTNFAVFLIFLTIGIVFAPFLAVHQYLNEAVATTMFITVLLAFYNMLPVYPLDGSKVLRWNRPVFLASIAIIFVFFFIAATALGIPPIVFMIELVFLLCIALVLSFFFGSFRF